jgi:hypothetical protein
VCVKFDTISTALLGEAHLEQRRVRELLVCRCLKLLVYEALSGCGRGCKGVWLRLQVCVSVFQLKVAKALTQELNRFN